MKRFLKILTLFLFASAITSGILYYIHTSQEEEAKQACNDYIVDQTAKGTPIVNSELLHLWSSQEGKNLYAEPAILTFLTTSDIWNSTTDENTPALIAAVDRFTKGMQDCETISLIPVRAAKPHDLNALYQSAAASKELYDRSVELAQIAANNDNFDVALTTLHNLHEIESKRSEHVLGLMDMTVQILEKQTLAGATQRILAADFASVEPTITAEQLEALLFHTRNWNTLKGWGNIYLYERGFQYQLYENLGDNSDSNPWNIFQNFRYSETFHEAQLILWKAMEEAYRSPASGWDLKSAEHSLNVLNANISGHTAPNPFLKEDFEAFIHTFDDTRQWLDGLNNSLVIFSAHELLLACYHQKVTTGNFPETLDDVTPDILPADKLSLLKSAHATLGFDDGIPFVQYITNYGSLEIFPMEGN